MGIVKKVKSFKGATVYTKDQKGSIITLFSGAASFNMFVNEFDRGEKFVTSMINYL